MFVVLISSLSFAFASDVSGNMTLSDSNDQNTIETADIQEDVLGEGEKSFSQLDSLINNESVHEGGHVDLDDGYSFYDSDSASVGTNGISINKSITVDGKMHTLDASGKSSIFRIGNNSHVILQNIIFTNGNGTDGGAIYVESGSSVEIINCTFQNNFALHNGGAIFTAADSTSISTIYNSIFTQNSAANGGAIYNTASTLKVTLSSFSYNVASNYGGSMYAGGAVNICDTIFDHERASGGGAIDLVNTIGKYSTIENSTFQNCNATGDGGAAYIRSDNVAVKNVKFIDNTAGDDGGAIYWEGSNGIIYNITCTNNKGISLDKNSTDTSSTRGGAICLTGGNVTISKSSFTSNSAYMDEGKNSSKVDGGALFITGNGVTIDDVTFKDNSATNNGGALYVIGNGTKIMNCDFTGSNAKDGAALFVEGKDCKLYDSNFTYNIASGNGGAVYWEGHNGVIKGSRFENNEAVGFGDKTNYTELTNNNTGVVEKRYNVTGGEGGAIMWEGANGLIEDSTFYKNTAEYSGGAIYIIGDGAQNGKNITFKDCDFTENLAKLNGGAINWASGASNANVTGSQFTGNTAYRSGGAIYISGNYLDIKDTEFTNNKATQQTTYDNRTSAGVFSSEGGNAGAICWMGSYGTVDNGTFISNTATVRGGAIQFERNQNGTVKNSRFTDNTAGDDGGAIDWYQGASNGQIINTEFVNNRASEDGGAVYIEGNDCKVLDATFTSNNAADEGGAVYVVGNRTHIEDCDFINSNAKDGAALFVNGTDCEVYNSTFTNNVAEDDGGAIFWEGDRGLMYNITCVNNKGISSGSSSSRGGTICLAGDNVTVDKSHFESSNVYSHGENIATSKVDGGAIFITGNNVAISETEFDDCSAFDKGGAIYVLGNESQILDCKFTYTQAYIGGAIFVEGNGVIIDNSLFRHNDGFNETEGGGSGGAIYVQGDNATISNSDFAYDKVINYGGAISVWGANANMINNIFDNCTTTSFWGGAIYTNGENATISLSNFTRCRAESVNDRGGAIQVSGDKANILDCNFEDCFAYFGGVIDITGSNAFVNNSSFKRSATFKLTDTNIVQSPQEGGAININGKNATILLSNFTDFTSEGYGGAIFVSGTNTNISECDFLNCKANTYNGGAIYIKGQGTNIENSNFTSCNAINDIHNGAGGAICVENGPDTIIKGSDFIDCEAKQGGSIYVFGNGATIESSTFNKSLANYGGAVYLEAWGSVVKQSNFSHCNADFSGGAIYVSGGGTTVIESDFEDCLAMGDSSQYGGGAIYLSGSYNNISGSTFNHNGLMSNGAYGGTIYISQGQGTNIERSYFNKSYNAGQGGIIYIMGDEVIISLSTFANSSSVGYGGAISVVGQNATIQDSNFENLNSNFGGAIYVNGESSDILRSSFDNCVARNNGGAIYINHKETTVGFSNFTLSNAATGGAIYINGVNTTITYCNLDNNTAGSAGAIKVFGSDTILSNCNFTYNIATSTSGGALDIGGSNASVYYSWFDHNDAKEEGGAINWQGGHGDDSIIGSTFTFNNCNATIKGGGAIYWTASRDGVIGSGGLIEDCFFINNTASGRHGGAIDWFHALDSVINNCLFVNNTSFKDGGALYTGDQKGRSNNLTVSNCQFYNNTAGSSGGALANQMANALVYNNVFDGNKAAGAGGSILMKEGPARNSIIDHCHIYNSFAETDMGYGQGGGAIYIGWTNAAGDGDKNITISNCDIINSSANRHGGAIAVLSRECSLINVTIQNVETFESNGGAIFWSGPYGTFNNVTIFNSTTNDNNKNEANGGAIYLSGAYCNLNDINITTSSTNISNLANRNSAYGGAIYISGDDTTLTNVIIDDSQSLAVGMNAHGGAIYWKGTGGTLINATISNTLANGQGGAIYWSGSSPTVENISIEYSQTNVTNSSNTADGGAIYSTGIDRLTNVHIIDSLASTNKGDVKGGAIYYNGIEMNNVTVIGSRASTESGTSYGGAVYWVSGGNGNLYNSSFERNTADLGGAVLADRAIYVDNTSFVGNVALDGGALYAQNGEIKLNNVTFELNSAKRGGAIFIQKVSLKIDRFSSLRNNTAEEKGGAIYYVHKEGLTTYVRNSDLVNNTAFQGSAIYATKFFELTNTTLLDNQANSKEFIDKHVGVDETGRNYTSAVFVGFDNVLNAIWVEENVISIACTNVTYWGVNGRNVSNSVPRRSDREVWQNVTIEMFNEEGAKIKESQVVTDADGRCIYYFNAEPGKTYYFAYTHETDRYYTYLRETLANRSLVKVYVYNPLYYQQNQSILISLTDGAWGDLNGTVNVTMKGPYNKTFIIEVINGTYRIENISGLPLGDYNVSASYDGDIDHTGDSDWVLFTVLPYDDLHITKDVNITADLVNVSDIIKYTINVTNHGPSDAIGVNVTEILSPYLELLDNKTTRGYYNYTNGTWFIGNLDVDETVTLTIIAKIIHMGPITNTVWVTGLGNDTNITNNIDSAHNFTAVPLTDLNITKEVNVTGDTINVLDRLKFTITVSNYGPSNATGVIVAENLNDHLKLISYETSDNSIYENGTWHIGTLANGANVTLTIVAEVIYSGNITNAVRVSGFENETNYTNNYDSIKNITAIANVDVGIIKTVNVTGFVNVTDLIQFNITVYNNGPCNASGVFVKEALDEAYLEMVSFNATRGDYNGYTWVIDNLNKGDLLNLTIIAKVINVGNFGNAVSIFSIDNDTNTSNNNDSIDNITSLPIVDLSIVKEVNGGSVVNVSDEIVFKITVRNNGPWDATNVTVVEVLSPHLEMTSNSTWGGFYNATSGIWYIGDLAKDDWRELVIVAKVISPGIISNVVVVNSTENDTNKSNNNDTIKNITALPVVDLAITKEVNVAVVNVSGRITFTINVTNNGPCNATQVYVNEVLSPELKLISNVTENGYYNVTEGIWHIGNLNNGSNATLTLVCEVMGNGTIVNYVNVTSYENDTDLSNNEYEVIFLANPIVDVSITKEVNVTASDFVYLGDKIQFTITIHNAGPSNATGVWVSEILDIAHLRLVSYNATKGTYDNATWKDIGKLNNGSTETLTIVAEVISLGNITNAVTVYSTEDDTNMSNNNDTIDNITVTPIVDLAITKRVDFGSGVVNVGDSVQFTINVVNNGPCDATNVTVVEVLSPLLNMTGHLIHGGEYNVTSGIWYIGKLSAHDFAQLIIQAKVISNGTISNFVAVTSNETDTNKSNNNDTIDNITALPVVDLAITKQVSASVVNVSDRIQFTINVTNNGPCNATHVNVSEILGPHLKLISNVTQHGYYNVTDGIWYIGDLTNHTNATLTIVCEAIKEGFVVNHVRVSCYENDTNPYNNYKDVPFTISPIVDISIKKEVNVTGFVNVTDEIKFTITVHNDGPCNATSVMVLETLDSHLGLVSYNASKGEYNGVSWFIGDLNSGDNATLNITAKVKYAGNFSNMVNVSSYEADTNMSNNYDNITNITALYLVDLAITKTANIWGASGNIAKVGDTVQFIINVYNYGPCDATNVTVVEVLDSHLNMTGHSVYRGEYNVTSGIWYIGDLPDEGSAQLIIVAKVISPGTISNFVSINSTENDTNKSNNNDTIDNITALPVVDLVINKQTNASIVTIGDKIEFNITVYNKGPCNATQVNVSEMLDDFQLISAVTPNGYYNQTGGYWYIGNLTVGATAKLTITCELMADGIFSNYVEVSSYENDTYPYDNWDIVYVSTTPIVDVSITKRVNVTTNIVNVGELIEFTITVHNDGPSDATSVIVGEIITEPLHLVSSNPSIGSYSEGTWNVGNLANNATETLTLVCKVMYTADITNFVNVTSYQNDTNMSNNYDNITNLTAAVNVDVGIIKTVNVTGTVHVGDYVEFNITVYNNGPCNATSVSVVEILDLNHLELKSNVTTKGPYNGYSWDIGTLNMGETVNMTLVVRVKAPGVFTNYVNVTSFENDTNRSNNEANITNITALPAVDLEITKVVTKGAGVVNVTDLVQFIITVVNKGPCDATNVTVVEVLSPHLNMTALSVHMGDYNVTSGIWYIGDLAANTGDFAQLTIEAMVISNGTISNFVAVTSNETDRNESNNNDTIENITALPLVDVNITKEVNVTSGFVNVGDEVKFTIVVHNNGPSNATDVVAYDKLSGLLEFARFVSSRDGITYDDKTGKITIGNLYNNETVTLNIIAKVIGNGTVDNKVNVTSHENDTNKSNNNDSSDNFTSLPVVDLTITKEVNVTTGVAVNVSDYVKFTITVHNNGPSNATGVNVTEVLDSHLRMDSNVTMNGYYSVGDGVWYIGDLNNGSTAVLTIVCEVISNGTVSNFVIVTSNENETNKSDNNDTIDNITALPVVDVNITKEVNVTSGFVNVGDEVKFTIVVHNNGPSNATDVVAYDKLSGLLEFARFVSSRDGITYDDKTGKITIGNLYNNETVTLNIIAKVIGNGTVDNKVNVTSHENDTNKSNNNDSSDNFTALPVVDLNITKVVNVTVAYVDEYASYTINVTNRGPSGATDVVAYDKLSDLLELISFVPNREDIKYDNATGKITIGSLKVNETVRMVMTVKIKTNGTIPNSVNVTSHENDTNPTDNNDSSENITALPVVKLSVIKYSNVTGSINVTDLVKFTINVTNYGPSNATWIEISDDLIKEFEFVNATGNWTRNGQKVTWTIPRVNNGTTVSVDLIVRVLSNGTFENVATAKSNENITGAENKTNVTANPLVDVKVNKTVDRTEVNVGENVKYTIYVVNNGPSNATDVNVKDKLDEHLYFMSFESNRTGITYNKDTGIATIGNLNANETVVLYIVAKVIERGVIPNVVIVTSNENDTNTTNNNYTSENVTADKRITPIDLDAYDIYYGDDEILTVTLPRGATGTVNITVNGTPYVNVPINEGIATLPLHDLGGGDYNVTVVYGGNNEYVGNSTKGSFKVMPITPTIKIEVVDIWVGEVEVLNVTVNAPGTVNITVNGITIEIPLDHQIRYTDVLKSQADKLKYDGKATWVLINLPVGTYPAFAIYNGNENYTSVNTSDVFHVRDLPSTVVVTAKDIYVGEDAFINIKVGPKDFNGTVDVIVDGKVYNNVKLVNGRANLTVSGLKAGLKHVYVKFNGTILYRPSENTTTFKVLKLKPPVNVDAPTIEVGEDGVITVTVPEDATGTITINVDGKTYTRPIKNGKAVFVIPGLEVGVHDIVAFYSGDDKYLPSNATGTIEVTPGNGSDHGHGSGLSRHATGNPIFVLVVVIMAFVLIPIRRFKK